MDKPIQAIKIAFPFTLWDRMRASFVLTPQRRLGIILVAIWPVIGLSFLAFMLTTGRPLNFSAWTVVAGSLLFYPAMVVLGTTAAHYGNRHMREPFTYSFDDSGIHVSARSYEYTHRWSTISRVRKSGGFLMFFFSPGCAHCIPLRAVESTETLGALVALAKRRGASVDGT